MALTNCRNILAESIVVSRSDMDPFSRNGTARNRGYSRYPGVVRYDIARRGVLGGQRPAPRRAPALEGSRSGRIDLKMVRLLILPAIVLPLAAASLPAARPEEVGLSSERLQRIHEMVMRHVAARDISGAVTMVARRGRVVHFEAHGLMDIEAKKPMTKAAVFGLALSSTSPNTSRSPITPRSRWRPCAAPSPCPIRLLPSSAAITCFPPITIPPSST